jgi:aspartate/methionine/tyrosine aminotransferase
MSRKRDLFLGYLAQTGLAYTTPEGAYYTLVDISPLGFANDRVAAEELTRRIGVTGVKRFSRQGHEFVQSLCLRGRRRVHGQACGRP